VPDIRPFRGLRYAPDVVGDLADVVSPPYDVISADQRRRLVERHPANVVAIELPVEEAGDEPDDRYRRAARTFAGWRSDGTLRKDPRPAVYVYEQTYAVPGSGDVRMQRGFFARLRLEPLGVTGGVLPHERTLSGPKEDRYRLLRATGANVSPVVVIQEPQDETERLLATVASEPSAVDLTDEDGVRHRLWVVADGGDPDGPAARLCALAGQGPVTIADGHHRYETALRYRDERRVARSGEEDPAFDHLMVLVLGLGTTRPTILPTHRLVTGLGDDGARRLLERAGELFEVAAASPQEVVERMAGQPPADGGRIGLLTRAGSAMLRVRRDAIGPFLPPGGEALRLLDVTVLGVALDRLAGVDPAAVTAGERVRYSKSAADAAALMADPASGVDAAFLLDPTPVEAVVAVARDGDVMPQKSTYFYPKAITGLVINPHES
jgi:uncharacterized protein (DUF1015 family)